MEGLAIRKDCREIVYTFGRRNIVQNPFDPSKLGFSCKISAISPTPQPSKGSILSFLLVFIGFSPDYLHVPELPRSHCQGGSIAPFFTSTLFIQQRITVKTVTAYSVLL